MFKKYTLSNGLRVVLAPMAGSQSVTLLVLVGTGSKYETKEMFSSEMMQEREKDTLRYLKGIKCDTCGTVYYLKSTCCKK